MMRMTRANVGNATAAGATGKTALAMVKDMCVDIRRRCCERTAEFVNDKEVRKCRSRSR